MLSRQLGIGQMKNNYVHVSMVLRDPPVKKMEGRVWSNAHLSWNSLLHCIPPHEYH
jgi:hypothetical protein